MAKSSKHSPSVAVVVLNWNGQSLLEQFLPSLIMTDYPNLEIVVADNASSDGSVEFLQANYPDIRLIQLPRNFGFAGGYNHALRQVDTAYYVLLNSDVEVTSDWLWPLVETIANHPGRAAVMPKIKAFHQKQNFEYAGGAGGFMDRLGYTFCRGRIFDTIEPDNGQYDKPGEVFWASGAALLISAKLYHDIGGLDERFFAHMEEIDLCWRLKNAGYEIWCQPESVVYHVGGASLSQVHPRKVFLNFRNNAAMILKNEKKRRLFWLYPLRLLLDVVAATKALITGKPREAAATIAGSFTTLFLLFGWLRRRMHYSRWINANRIGPPNSTGRLPVVLIWEYFFKRKRIFTDYEETRSDK